MNPLTLNVMLLLFLVASATTYWRWRLRRGPVQVAWFLIYAAGVTFYAWLQSPYYDDELSRWWVRALFVALVLPHVLENIEMIRRQRRR